MHDGTGLGRLARRGVSALAGALLVTGGLAIPAAQHAAAQPAAAPPAAPHRAPAPVLPDNVTVSATSGLGTIPSDAVGLGTAVYDGDMNDAPIPGLLKAAGIDALRYPGGSYSDIYNWQTGTAAAGGYVAPNTGFASFMATAKAAGAEPVITANYGTGTPALAAAWAQNAAASNDGVKYWEIGNEVYGNGTYGANWEADAHCNTTLNGSPVTIGSEPAQTYNCGPGTYAANVLQYTSAIHAVSPSARICTVLTTPGFWPDGVTNAEYPQSWNQTVLTALGAHTQCVIVHYYPGGSSVAGNLAQTTGISGIIATLRSQISQYAGITDPSSVPILVSETNAQFGDDTQPGALFAADEFMTWMENGVANVDWWNEHNGAGTITTVGGATDYGDQGIFSNGSTSQGVTEPPAETPFGPYYGIEMLTKLGSPGDQMVTSTSSNPLVRVHAVRRAGGSLDVLIANEDPANAYTVGLTTTGFTASGPPTVYTYANNATSITSATQSSASSVTVQPYSITVVQIPGSGGTGVTAPGAPGQPAVSGLSSSTSSNTSGSGTLSWPASAAGTNPVASYQVYSEGSGGSTLVAATSGTSLALSGLTVGASYTYDVVAVDTQGNHSLPSPPVSFTVPPPSNSTCAVHYTVTSSWPGGFGGSITLTNKGSAAISPWSLTFRFPASGEAVQSGWNGTWSQSGAQVTVNAASWDSTIAANGGTVRLGFNGTDSGQDPAPTVFSINGTACANN
jgi:hypothetical protein